MRELREAFKQFPEWFKKTQWENIQYYEVITDLCEIINPIIFKCDFNNLKMKYMLSIDRFESVYYKDGHQNIEATYYALAEKIKVQFLTELRSSFLETMGDITI